MNIIAIDPGKSGAIAWGEKSVIGVIPMPSTPAGIASAIKGISDDKTICVIEDVHSMPRQGVASTFTFGQWCGYVEMAATSMGIPVHRVRPQVWMKYFTSKKSSDFAFKSLWKKSLYEIAARRNPKLVSDGKLVKESLADAVLLWEYFYNALRP